MTLSEYMTAYPPRYAEKRGESYRLIPNQEFDSKWGLWHLSDYAISTVSSFFVTLVPRMKESA